MKLHANAALSLNKRRLLCRRVVEQKWTLTKAAAAAEVSVRCARKWVGRYRAEGELGLLDRPSTPAVVANRTCERRVQTMAALRRLRFTGPEIAETLTMPLSTVSGILQRIGMGRLGRLGLEPAERYERERQRTAALHAWLDYYNHRRRHSALGHKPPIARLNERTNLLGTYS
jgi:transposase